MAVLNNQQKKNVFSGGWKQLQVGAEATIILCYILPGSMWQVDCMNYKGKPCLGKNKSLLFSDAATGTRVSLLGAFPL